MIAKVWLVEELFYYSYPFYLPNIFQQKLTKHELHLRAKLFQVFSSMSIEKEVYIEDFFNHYPSVLNNQQKTKIKKQLIELFSELKDSELIEDRICLDNDSDIDIKNCMPVMLSKNKYIYFWEKV